MILAGALFSIMLNPAMFRLIQPTEKYYSASFQNYGNFWTTTVLHRLNWMRQLKTMLSSSAMDGWGRHIVSLLGEMSIPHLVVEADAERVSELGANGIPSLFGDAANSEVLTHAGLGHARALVVAGPDEDASALVVTAARDLAPNLPIIARASTEEGTKRLAKLGAQEVIYPALEGGLEIVRHTLLQLGFPLTEIYRYTDAVRRDHYNLQIDTEEEHRLLHELINASNSIEIKWFSIPPGNLARRSKPC